MSVESARCGVCGSDRAEALFRLRYPAFATELFLTEPELLERLNTAEPRLWRCDCGFRYVSPRLSAEHVRSQYRSREASYFAPYADPARLGSFRAAARLLERFAPPGPVLDVGCSGGEFLAELDRRFVPLGLELSPAAAGLARESAAVLVADSEALPLRAESLVGVTAFDLLEHLPEPGVFLHEAARVLRPGGVLVIETGDAASFAARWGRERWYYLAFAEHIGLFDGPSLSTALRTVGLEPAVVQRRHHVRLGFHALKALVRGFARLGLRSLLKGLAPSSASARRLEETALVPLLWDHLMVAAVKRTAVP